MAERLITWVVPIADKSLEAVEGLLAAIAEDPRHNAHIPFARLRMVHFASLTLFNREDAQRRTLVFESNIDAPLGEYVRSLVECGVDALNVLFADAEDFPGRATVAFLLHTCQKPKLYHVGHPGRLVDEVRGDHELRRSIARELAEHPELQTKAPLDIIRALRKTARCPGFLRSCVRPWHPDWSRPPDRATAATPLTEIRWVRDSFDWLRIVREAGLYVLGGAIEFAAAVVLGRLLLVPLMASLALVSVIIVGLVSMSAPDERLARGFVAGLGIAAAVWLVFWESGLDPITNMREWLVIASSVVLAPTLVIAASYLWIAANLTPSAPTAPVSPAARERIQKLAEAEDRPEHDIYNHVAGLSPMVTGWTRPFRRARTLTALMFLNMFYRTYFVRGKLVSIGSIHFAQWTLLPDGILFLTNYDGSADSYLDDFFNSLAKGVAFIWWDMANFPGTTDPRRLKLWVREGQTLARVRYRAPAYDALTVDMINNNLYIRKCLLRGRRPAAARRWIRRFATTPDEPTLFWRAAHWLSSGMD